MTWKKGQSGNPRGAPKRMLISSNIERELLQAADDGDVTKARLIAKKVVALAVSGEPWAIQFVTERTEGKPEQRIDITRHVRDLADEELLAIAAGSGDGAATAQDGAQEHQPIH